MYLYASFTHVNTNQQSLWTLAARHWHQFNTRLHCSVKAHPHRCTVVVKTAAAAVTACHRASAVFASSTFMIQRMTSRSWVSMQAASWQLLLFLSYASCKVCVLQSHHCMLMSLSNAQYHQTWHLSTQLHSGERTGRRLLWSATLLLLTDPTIRSQVSISLVIHGLWWTVSGQAKDHVVLTCTNEVLPDHLLVIAASDRP